ncbi:MAG: hypothetical protein JXL80_17620 [Planctomycetes bacterium]|nr:hypothetical protein [Planctomycetota bacterium]
MKTFGLIIAVLVIVAVAGVIVTAYTGHNAEKPAVAGEASVAAPACCTSQSPCNSACAACCSKTSCQTCCGTACKDCCK